MSNSHGPYDLYIHFSQTQSWSSFNSHTFRRKDHNLECWGAFDFMELLQFVFHFSNFYNLSIDPFDDISRLCACLDFLWKEMPSASWRTASLSISLLMAVFAVLQHGYFLLFHVQQYQILLLRAYEFGQRYILSKKMFCRLTLQSAIVN